MYKKGGIKMKKSIVSALLFMSIIISSSDIYAESTRALRKDIAQVKQQTGQVTPVAFKKLNTIEKALKMFDDTIFCLLFGKKCTPRDRLVINYTLGFMIGYYRDNASFMLSLLKKYKISDPKAIVGAVALQEILASISHMRGALITPYLSAIKQAILSAVFITGEIKNIAEQTMKEESVISFLKELSRWTAMNFQCIWSEQYCRVFNNNLLFDFFNNQEVTPAAKREGLYFWLGFISGFMWLKRDYCKKQANILKNWRSKQKDTSPKNRILSFFTSDPLFLAWSLVQYHVL
jgi:hypothetical protein